VVLPHQIIVDLYKDFDRIGRVGIASPLRRKEELSCQMRKLEERSNEAGEDEIDRREEGHLRGLGSDRGRR
jgi:hypothetical protein